jgi:ribosomal protein L7Ae-like RNA K-turn-binding protein
MKYMIGLQKKWRRVSIDKALNYLSLARKAGRIELGEEPVGAAARAKKARLILVASDAGDHSWRRAKSFVAGTDQQCIRLPFTKDELGQSIGRQELAIAAFTDPALALAFVKALPQPEKYSEYLENLDKKTTRIRQRQAEEKAHQRNKKRK